LRAVVAERFPDVDADAAIRAGHVWVDGFPVRNPASRVAATATIEVRAPRPLAGEAKLRAALAAFAPPVAGRVAIDIGAAAGGFTRVLLEAGARRVYAVDAGFGQLLGSLRQDPRVVNLEATNLGSLSRELVPDAIDVVTIDVSYLALARAVPQLEVLELAPEAVLIGLVKPMFELATGELPDDDRLPAALAAAAAGIAAAGGESAGAIPSPVLGHGGAKELLIHARRAGLVGRARS
jgi:23S rRNA (cytidine1920-2'-O)/16S rRNA (cytidine1409-2'-O)-methyltransferase